MHKLLLTSWTNRLYLKPLQLSKRRAKNEKISVTDFSNNDIVLIDLDKICKSANRVLKDNGVFSLVHRTDRLIEILSVLRKYNLEPKTIKFVHNTFSDTSTLVLIQSQKCGKVGLKVLKPFILRNSDGTFTEEYKRLQEEIIV